MRQHSEARFRGSRLKPVDDFFVLATRGPSRIGWREVQTRKTSRHSGRYERPRFIPNREFVEDRHNLPRPVGPMLIALELAQFV